MSDHTLPEQDAESFEYAGFWLRAAAWLIDSYLSRSILTLMFLVLYAGNAEYVANMMTPDKFPGFWNVFLDVVLTSLAIVVFWVYWQATPGKWVISAKILDARSGQKPTNWQYVGRYFSYLPSFLIFGLGFFWIAFDEKKQGWHDKLAGTVVVRRKNSQTFFPDALPGARQSAPPDAQSSEAP